MDQVCLVKPSSPLCGDWDQLKDIYILANEHGIHPLIPLAISYAESRLGTDFAPKWECNEMNNRGGVKGFKQDDGTVLSVPLPYEGCWLYPFKSMHDYWHGLMNTLSMGYVDAGCDNLRCLSAYYVGKPGAPKDGWVKRAEYFLNFK